jgi:hypothetical protein
VPGIKPAILQPVVKHAESLEAVELRGNTKKYKTDIKIRMKIKIIKGL